MDRFLDLAFWLIVAYAVLFVVLFVVVLVFTVSVWRSIARDDAELRERIRRRRGW